MESWERMKQAVAGRWTGKPGKTGTTVLNPSESRGTVPVSDAKHRGGIAPSRIQQKKMNIR